MRTAEYPDVAKKKPRLNYVLIYVYAFLSITLISFLIDVLVTGTISSSLWAVFITPCAWSLLFRPFLVKKLCFASYILCDVAYISILMLWASWMYSGNFSPAVSFGIPLISVVASLFLCAGLLIFGDRRVRALLSFMALGGVNLLLLIISLAGGYSALPGAVSVLLCAVPAALLFVKYPEDARDELKAKFHF